MIIKWKIHILNLVECIKIQNSNKINDVGNFKKKKKWKLKIKIN